MSDIYTHADDGFCVLELVSDWLVDLSVEEGLDREHSAIVNPLSVAPDDVS